MTTSDTDSATDDVVRAEVKVMFEFLLQIVKNMQRSGIDSIKCIPIWESEKITRKLRIQES